MPIHARYRWFYPIAGCGLLSVDDACARYGISLDELLSWKSLSRAAGVRGLHVNPIQDHRNRACQHADVTSRIPPFWAEVVAERIVALALAKPPGETTHWTGRSASPSKRSSKSCAPRAPTASGRR